MYYEEKQIDGVWYWRGAPDDDWTPFNATKLYQKLAQKDARIAELEKALREIAALDYKNAATNGAAYDAVQIAKSVL